MKFVAGVLLALLKLSRVGVAATDDAEFTDEPSCRARARVRAPDLDAGRVVQGDVKVKLDGKYPEVLGYTLKLRFAERSWVKTRYESCYHYILQLIKLSQATRCSTSRTTDYEFSASYRVFDSNIWNDPFLRYPGGNKPDWDKYKDVVRDPSLWLVREEERIGFEAKYNLCDGQPTD